MTTQEIFEYLVEHYDEFPNFDGRTPDVILRTLPDQDIRYDEGEAGLVDMLNDIDYL